MVIDKSIIDTLLCGDKAFLMVARMLKEGTRVLKPNGVYFSISYGKPESRAFHFESPHLDFEMKSYSLFPESAKTPEEKEEKSHYLYIGKKRPSAMETLKEYWPSVELKLIKDWE